MSDEQERALRRIRELAEEHDGALIMRANKYYVICSCGWTSSDEGTKSSVEAEHEMHVELVSTPPEYFDQEPL
jgi:hypothetical protein